MITKQHAKAIYPVVAAVWQSVKPHFREFEDAEIAHITALACGYTFFDLLNGATESYDLHFMFTAMAYLAERESLPETGEDAAILFNPRGAFLKKFIPLYESKYKP